jgi:hypothetical protein
MLLDELHPQMRDSAAVVAVFDQRDRGIRRASDMVMRLDGWLKDAHAMLLPLHAFQRFEDTVGAGIDGNRRAIAPKDPAVAIDDEQGAFANTIAIAIERQNDGLTFGVAQ